MRTTYSHTHHYVGPLSGAEDVYLPVHAPRPTRDYQAAVCEVHWHANDNRPYMELTRRERELARADMERRATLICDALDAAMDAEPQVLEQQGASR